MSVIAIFSGIFCSADAVVRDVMDSTGYRHDHRRPDYRQGR